MEKECALKYLNAPLENPSTHCARLLKNVIRLVACETTALFLQNGDTFFLKLNSQFLQRYCQPIQIRPITVLFKEILLQIECNF